MKMVLHYLKFDFLRWRWLLLAMWLLVCVYTGLMAWLASFVGESRWPLLALTPSHLVFAAGVLSFTAICLLAGGADSPAAAQRSWLMTRPRRGRSRVAARVVVILCGAVLPALTAWSGTMLAMKFGIATLSGGLLEILGGSLAFAAVLALWGLVRPCVPGVILGMAAGSVAFLLATLLPGAASVKPFFRKDAATTTVLFALIAGALPGLAGIWRRQHRREWALTGLFMGVLCTLALSSLLPLQNWFFYRSSIDPLHPMQEAEEKILPVSKVTQPLRDAEFLPGLELSFGEAVAEAFDRKTASSAQLMAVSWREAGGEWSLWITWEKFSRGSAAAQSYPFNCSAAHLPALRDGEIRLGLQLSPPDAEVFTALQERTSVSGSGWSMEVLPLATSEDGRVRLTYVNRARTDSPSGIWFDRGLLNMHGWQANGHHQTWWRLPWVTIKPCSQTCGPQSWQKNVSASLPESSLIWRSPDQLQPRYHILRLTGVNVSHRVKKSEPKPARQLPLELLPPSLTRQPSGPSFIGKTPQPLTDLPPPPGIPGPEAPALEVAEFLQRRIQPNWSRGAFYPYGKDEAAALAALQPRHLILFLRMLERLQSAPPDYLLDAVSDGAVEGQRQTILDFLPRIPLLLDLVEKRGWSKEAQPVLLRAMLEKGIIPVEWYGREAIDWSPSSLTALVEKSWRADFASVRMWSANPGLARKLEERRALVREYLPELMPLENEMSGLLFGMLWLGDAAVLDAVLERLAEQGRQSLWRATLQPMLRTASGAPVSSSWDEFQKFTAGSRAADYQFDATTRTWNRKPVPPP